MLPRQKAGSKQPGLQNAGAVSTVLPGLAPCVPPLLGADRWRGLTAAKTLGPCTGRVRSGEGLPEAAVWAGVSSPWGHRRVLGPDGSSHCTSLLLQPGPSPCLTPHTGVPSAQRDTASWPGPVAGSGGEGGGYAELWSPHPWADGGRGVSAGYFCVCSPLLRLQQR